jgi:hypothetical protein
VASLSRRGLNSLMRELTTCFTESTTGGRILYRHNFIGLFVQ